MDKSKARSMMLEGKDGKKFAFQYHGTATDANRIIYKVETMRELLVNNGEKGLDMPGMGSNLKLLERAFDHYIDYLRSKGDKKSNGGDPKKIPNSTLSKKRPKKINCCPKMDEPMFVTSSSTVPKLINQVQNHAFYCSGGYTIINEDYQGYTFKMILFCNTCWERIPWCSSPLLPDNKPLVDYRLAHAALTAGLAPDQHRVYHSTANIGAFQSTLLKPAENIDVLPCKNPLNKDYVGSKKLNESNQEIHSKPAVLQIENSNHSNFSSLLKENVRNLNVKRKRSTSSTISSVDPNANLVYIDPENTVVKVEPECPDGYYEAQKTGFEPHKPKRLMNSI